MNNITNNNLHHAFYPDDQLLVYEKGMYINNRENKEYTIYIDTAYRNFENNPNPFNFQIEFTPLAGVENISFPIKVDEANYIHFRLIMLPLRLLTENIVNQRYLVLRCKELSMQYQYFCSSKINSQTDIILFNLGIQGYNLLLEAKSVITFRDDLKPKLTKLTFQFLTSDGETINVPNNLQGATEENSLILFNSDDTSTVCDEVNPSAPYNNVFIEMKLGINDMQILGKTSA